MNIRVPKGLDSIELIYTRIHRYKGTIQKLVAISKQERSRGKEEEGDEDKYKYVG
jgi:hypothetical protein